ncbi:MAG: signal peptide protein [Pseudonocardiales bacterium]|nr:signal peptide protein [Pseudonocardiales bacterium]
MTTDIEVERQVTAHAHEVNPQGLNVRRGYAAGLSAIAATFLVLVSVVLAGSVVIADGSSRAHMAVLLNAAYQQAASGVEAEESLERKYRLEPGPVPLSGHTAAEAQVSAALSEVRRLGGARDRELVAAVSGEHAKYVAAATILHSAVDRHEPLATINSIDNRQVDPIFSGMQTAIYAAAGRHAAAALSQVARSRNTARIVVGLDIATLIVGLGAIIAAGISLVRSQQRLRAQRDTNRHLAFHDSLTGLPNRALFQDRTEQALLAARRSGDQVVVMLADLDRFKDVNDTLGHHYGDLLLAQVALRFTGTLRAHDSVARLGGDEFAIVLSSASREDAVQAAGRLTEALSAPFKVNDIDLDVEASIGIALAGPDADVESLLRHADVAMYEAKTQHLPYAVYELQRDDNTVARLALLGDLRRGIGRGELVLFYQPKVHALTGELHSVEALVRWNNPTSGLLPPHTFIPIAESTAVIHPLTDEVLRQALAQARTWVDRGLTIPVAVNISARSLHDLDFPTAIKRHLDIAGVPATILGLELTESSIMTDPARALTVLTTLAEMGISLSIDDFGTGYSSMSYLKQLPVCELKIDRSFVMGLTDEPGDVVMVQSALDLGHNLGLSVVAEGVEDAATQRMLASMGCDEIQGYHISRPVPAELFDAWLAQRPRAGHRAAT